MDIISISIGGGDGFSSPYYLDPIAIGAYGAVSRGIFVSTSAGNDGPNGMSATNLAPWLTTVGAGTIDRNFPADIILGDGRKFAGVSLNAGEPLNGKMYPVVYPAQRRRRWIRKRLFGSSLEWISGSQNSFLLLQMVYVPNVAADTTARVNNHIPITNGNEKMIKASSDKTVKTTKGFKVVQIKRLS